MCEYIIKYIQKYYEKYYLNKEKEKYYYRVIII